MYGVDTRCYCERMKLNSVTIVALLLVVAGLACLIYGIITFADIRDSIAGRAINAIGGQTDQEKSALAFIIGGAAGIVVGVGLYAGIGKKKKGKKR